MNWPRRLHQLGASASRRAASQGPRKASSDIHMDRARSGVAAVPCPRLEDPRVQRPSSGRRQDSRASCTRTPVLSAARHAETRAPLHDVRTLSLRVSVALPRLCWGVARVLTWPFRLHRAPLRLQARRWAGDTPSATMPSAAALPSRPKDAAADTQAPTESTMAS
ncbi:hypothetical protein PHYPSEUDO_004122 [Phytophthora pseudosyringae]|uniref:Uncharacterized protein n=1 Tax=Phytophthora pseudosyringae TaxID=221518 RepID=A0A8T1WHN5_9STRA|nr:hypothetical protein PHYPSEUDO_004122 [Phytophthora pseudosyringae]